MAEMFGKKTGTCKGLGGSMHAAISVENGIILATAIVGSGIPIAAGIAMANKYLGKDIITTCFFGDGAVNTGAFHEGMNAAALWKLPILFVCENNLYAMSTHITRSLSSKSIADRAHAYNMEVLIADGNDVLSVYNATKEAIDMIRKGNCPVFIEARTYKMKGHGVYDEGKYRDPNEVAKWLERDPIKIYKNKLFEAKLIDEETIKKMERDISAEIEDAVQQAMKDEVLDFQELYKLVLA
ncbi:MAG TPA: thiamine pyrophosphate-dependent dehydrogenase E1 component subunit alpha, partial [Geobacterales bacterium]|nr:thiamine pyrophosphate-dependent dehydrogenase E1 component subunit alpha [Geobacterales bacterium]